VADKWWRTALYGAVTVMRPFMFKPAQRVLNKSEERIGANRQRAGPLLD
jgi:hypothetical protein